MFKTNTYMNCLTKNEINLLAPCTHYEEVVIISIYMHIKTGLPHFNFLYMNFFRKWCHVFLEGSSDTSRPREKSLLLCFLLTTPFSFWPCMNFHSLSYKHGIFLPKFRTISLVWNNIYRFYFLFTLWSHFSFSFDYIFVVSSLYFIRVLFRFASFRKILLSPRIL